MDDVEKRNLEVVEKAMTHLTLRREEMERGKLDVAFSPDHGPFFDACAEDVVFIPACPPDTPLVGGEHHGKEAVKLIFNETSYAAMAEERGLEVTPEMIRRYDVVRPLEYVVQGDRVVVFGAEQVFTVGGKVVGPMEFAMDIRLRDGLIAYYKHIQDLSDFYLKGAWTVPD